MSTEVLVPTRRRRWPIELKQQMLSEAELPGESICSVARRYDIDPAQLYQWRKKFRTDAPTQELNRPAFLPIEVNAVAPIELNDSPDTDDNRSGGSVAN